MDCIATTGTVVGCVMGRGGVAKRVWVGVEDGRGCREGRVRLRCGGRQARFW